jgi:predicted RecB family nuclease
MKAELVKIFEDLEAWLDHCREELIEYNPADLYRTKAYKEWQRTREYLQRKARRDQKALRDSKRFKGNS